MNNTMTVQKGTSTLKLAAPVRPPAVTRDGRAQAECASLLDAVRAGDPAEVMALLAAGADLDEKDGDGWTALMLVTVKGHLDVARELLNAGADLHAKNGKGWAALRLAVSMDDAEALRLLLEAGADVNSRDAVGDTALLQAAREGSIESLRLLLAHGADVNVSNDSGETALKSASCHGYHEIARLLRDAGASGQQAETGEAELFDDEELGQLMKQIEALAPAPAAPTETAAEQSPAPVAPAGGVLERLAAAVEALRPTVRAAPPRVSIAEA